VTDRIEYIVIGAGVVGLAVARMLALAGREVIVIDQADDIGSETSSRNSEVIHAGIYYPPGSLKARLCVRGKERLYRYCRDKGVEARAIGKLIVATSEAQLVKLTQLQDTALKSGVTDLRWLSRAEALEMEPELSCFAALHSPSTGIVDSRNYMLALQGDAEASGAAVVLHTAFVRARRQGDGFVVETRDAQGETSELPCARIVNCAGHGAHAVATATEGVDPSALPPRFLAKGSYCAVSGRSPFRHLIYPVPEPGGLGIHVTLDLQGRIRLGPNVEWVDALDYTVRPDVAAQFQAACRSYWPGITTRDVSSTYCGIRPKIHGPKEGFADFVIQPAGDGDIPKVINLFGIESPGLTSSLAIAEHVGGLLGLVSGD